MSHAAFIPLTVIRCVHRYGALRYGTSVSPTLWDISVPSPTPKNVLWLRTFLSSLMGAEGLEGWIVARTVQVIGSTGASMSAVSNVVPLPKIPAAAAEKQSEKKFGKTVMSHGLYIVPA